jgi:hypothetical protein
MKRFLSSPDPRKRRQGGGSPHHYQAPLFFSLDLFMSRVGSKKPTQKTQKTQKTPKKTKKPTGLVFFYKKTGFFQPCS